jgi:hypothetical protein
MHDAHPDADRVEALEIGFLDSLDSDDGIHETDIVSLIGSGETDGNARYVERSSEDGEEIAKHSEPLMTEV